MRNTVLHIQAKVHPVIASISVKFRGIKDNIDISKPWTSHFRISYRFRDICLDCRSFINITDWMAQKIILTEAIIHKWSSLSILLILHLMTPANLYYKDIGSIQTLIFVPKTVFHFQHYSQQSLHYVYFLQFSLISVRPPHFYLSLWNLQIALVTDTPGQLSSHYFYSGNQKRRIDYVDVRYMSQRSFVFTKKCFSIVLSQQ